MPHLRLQIKDITQWVDAPKTNATLEGADIYENGTSGGKVAIYLYFKDSDGKQYTVATTAALLDMLNGASLGAQMRWATRDKNN